MATVAVGDRQLGTPGSELARPLGASVRVATLALVALLPWVFGGNRPAAWSIMVVTVAGLLLVRGFGLLLQPDRSIALPSSVLVGAALFLGCLAWIAVQAFPDAPAELVHPAWSLLPPDIEGYGSISLRPDLTRELLDRLAAYGGLVALGFLMGQGKDRGERALWILIVVIALQATFGLLRSFSGWTSYLNAELQVARASGSFVNPNHFAAYVALGAVAVLVTLLREARGDAGAESLRVAIARLSRTLFEKHFWKVVLFVLMVAAVLASGSRGAALSLAVVTLVLAARIGGRAGTSLLVAALLLFAALLALLFFASGEDVRARLESMLSGNELAPGSGGRLDIWGFAIERILERPWSGHGYGSFHAVFHLARDERFPTVQFDYAHQTWLELAVELGIPAAFALLLAVALVLLPCWRARIDSPLPTIGLAVTALMFLHGMVDFAGQMPANAATWSLLIGMASGAAAAGNGRARVVRASRNPAAAVATAAPNSR